jgi:ParB-like nuclease domain
METVNINDILIENRMRKDLGDVDQLSKSIQENGLIQPIVLTGQYRDFDGDKITLVAGHRRCEALKKLGFTELQHGVHFLWRNDLINDEYRRNAVELEENLRRKNMTWSEEVLGKQRLLAVYQKIYGPPTGGRPTGAVASRSYIDPKNTGFGVRKLAELLNESPATTSQDLEMAALVTNIPILAKELSREAARGRLALALKIQNNQNTPSVAKPLMYKILVECDSEQHQISLLTQFRGDGLKCSPIVA